MRRRPFALLALSVAAWIRYLHGTDLDDEPIAIKDAMLDELQPVALASAEDPTFMLRNRELFGKLSYAPPFAEALHDAMTAIEGDGLRATLSAYVRGDDRSLAAR